VECVVPQDICVHAQSKLSAPLNADPGAACWDMPVKVLVSCTSLSRMAVTATLVRPPCMHVRRTSVSLAFALTATELDLMLYNLFYVQDEAVV
jgi:hypothetical protein